MRSEFFKSRNKNKLHGTKSGFDPRLKCQRRRRRTKGIITKLSKYYIPDRWQLFSTIFLKIYSTPDMWQTFSKVFRYLEILRAPSILSIYQCFKY